MNIVIFAGGTGRRLWPLSRQNSPKQFQIFKGDKSTLQMAVDRVREFGLDNIYISTNEKYKNTVKEQVPDLAEDHILTEPAKRDLAAAVGLSLLRLKQRGVEGPIAVLWADHLMDNSDNFRDALKRGRELVSENPEQFVLLAEEARFANEDMGWIQLGDKIKEQEYEFKGWKYRPETERCREMYESGQWAWNPGYFLFDIDYCLDLYQKYEPDMYEKLTEMVKDEGLLKQKYSELEKKHFDDAIAERLQKNQARVLKVDLGWSDPGTLYALKEAFVESKEENLEKGENIIQRQVEDSFIYNEQKDKLVAAVGLEGTMVINTEDVLLVCSKEKIKQIKPLLEELDEEGLEEYL